VLLQQVREHQVIEESQVRMLEGALELADVEVRQVMVPRGSRVSVAVNAPLEQLLEMVRRYRFSRYPVYEGSPEQIIGILHRKDLFIHVSERLQRQERGEPAPPFELRRLLREALFVPETRPLAALLEDFRHKRVHLAVVVDEFGSVQGMVTLADIMDTIVGEVRDEHEAAPAPLLAPEGGPGASRAGLVLDARISLLDLEHNHRIELPAGPGFETLAGFVLNHLGFIPQGGESFLHDGLRITVLEMEGRRVARVKIEPVGQRISA
jgi:CBS domain containing-hemolysin-like protein